MVFSGFPTLLQDIFYITMQPQPSFSDRPSSSWQHFSYSYRQVCLNQTHIISHPSHTSFIWAQLLWPPKRRSLPTRTRKPFFTKKIGASAASNVAQVFYAYQTIYQPISTLYSCVMMAHRWVVLCKQKTQSQSLTKGFISNLITPCQRFFFTFNRSFNMSSLLQRFELHVLFVVTLGDKFSLLQHVAHCKYCLSLYGQSDSFDQV